MGFEEKTRKKKYEAELEKLSENNSVAIKSAEYYKHLSDDLAGLIVYNDSILEDRARKMFDCGTYVETLNDKIIYANFCRQRLCPNCQRRRSLRTAANVLKMQTQLMRQHKVKFLHLVLTVPNCESFQLSDTIDMLYQASSRFFRSDEVKNKFKGVMRCLEVTYSPKYRTHTSEDDICGNCFHPHLHCLVAVGSSYGSGKNYLKQARIKELWQFYTGYSIPLNVHITAVPAGDYGAVCEIAKYCVKPFDFQCAPYERLQVVETIFSALHGRRLVQCYGWIREAFKALRIDIESDEILTPSEDFDNIKRYCYNKTKGCYERI